MRSPYRPLIEAAAKASFLDPDLVEAVVWQESSGKADAFRYEPEFWLRYCAKNPTYANEEPRRVASSYGLTQVMFTTAVDHGYQGPPEGLFDLATNLRYGCAVLKSMLDLAGGDTRLALAAYNGGWGNRTGDRPQAYADHVLARLRAIKEHP